MAAKKTASKAAKAAAKTQKSAAASSSAASSSAASSASEAATEAAEPVAPLGIWTRKMVEQAIAAFNDMKAVPAHDEDGVAGLVDDFYRFVDVVARGDVEVEGLSLAAEMIRLGHGWLEKNPRHIRINSPTWDKELVENTVRWFGSVQDDGKNVKDTVARVAAFERVWRSGHVEDGEARVIAQVFVEHVHAWVRKSPEARKAWDALN